MTTTTNGSRLADAPRGAPAPPSGADRPMPVAGRVVPPRSRRRPGLLAVGIALIALGGLAAVWLVNSAATRTPVLVITRSVPYGSVITAEDLESVPVSVDPTVQTIPAGRLNTVVGSVAATSLTAGSLLSPAQLMPTAPPGPGQVLVPVAIPPTRMPAGGLAPGDVIQIVDTPTTDADLSALPPQTFTASVVRVAAPDVNSVTVVDVTVPAADGPTVAALSATGCVAVVVEPSGR